MPHDRAHPYLGRLRYDDSLGWWEGSIVRNGSPVTLYLSLDDCEDEEALLATAEAVCRDLASWCERIEEFAVRELLPLKNESWRDEGESEVGADEFRRRMSLQSIALYPSGNIEFLHGDGGLFAGHSIQVSGTIEDGPTDADIPG
jgi:hypothetical protein